MRIMRNRKWYQFFYHNQGKTPPPLILTRTPPQQITLCIDIPFWNPRPVPEYVGGSEMLCDPVGPHPIFCFEKYDS